MSEKDALQDFKIWFEGFCAAAPDRLSAKQWDVLKDHIHALPDQMTGHFNTNIKAAFTPMLTDPPAVPRFGVQEEFGPPNAVSAG